MAQLERLPGVVSESPSSSHRDSETPHRRRSSASVGGEKLLDSDAGPLPVIQLESPDISPTHVTLSTCTKRDRIGAFFDLRGMLTGKSPSHWAVTACQLQFHDCYPGQEYRVNGPTQLQQSKNAKATLEMDQRSKELRMKKMRIQHERSLGSDPQYQRHLGLLLHPLTSCTDNVLRDMAQEFESEMMTIQESNERQRQRSMKTLANLVRMGTMTLRPSRKSMKSVLRQDARGYATHLEQGSGASAPLSNEQREKLLDIFQRSIRHVDGSRNCSDLMQRCTWFRFLHRCGLLGPDGGVPFSQAAAVFAMFAEASPGDTFMPLVLSLGNWANAIHHILRGPNFFRTEREYIDNMFNVLLPRCERRLNEEQSSGRAQGFDHLGWQGYLAEEQMCEPEVLQLLHEFERPLRQLFSRYASSSADDEASDSGSEDDTAVTKVAQSARRRMQPESFLQMLRDFGFFPDIVQQHSAQMHILAAGSSDTTAHHDCKPVIEDGVSSAGLISYRSFVHCLCRISFVYLSVYGNSIQRVSSSKRKCLWMLTFLRARSPGALDDSSSQEDIWDIRCTCNLDHMCWKSLVLRRLFHFLP